jgi:hypothetical protein
VDYSGVFKAVLEEDFIITARDNSKPYLKARISPFYDGDTEEYPLTYVPTGFWIQDLREGDEIWVRFWSGDIRRPYLWEVINKLPQDMLDQFSLPSVSDIDMPSQKDTFACYYYGESFYVLYTDGYAVIKYGDSIQVISPDSIVSIANKLEWGTTGSGKVVISSNTFTLKGLIDELMSSLLSMLTVGSPTTQAPDPATIAKWTALQVKFNTFFG